MSNVYLVKGYLIQHYSSNTESLYAVKADGSVYMRTGKLHTHDFNHHSAKWSSVEVLPANAEFIGNYPAPKQI